MSGRGFAWSCVVVVAGCGRIGFGVLGGGAGDSDASDDVAPSGPSCPTFATLCDDFESGGLMPKWKRVDTALGGTAVVTTARPHTGSFALEADGPTQAQDDAQGSPIFGFTSQTTGVLALREWINLSVPMTNFDLVAQFNGPNQYISAGGDQLLSWVSTEQVMSGMQGQDHPNSAGTAQMTPPIDTWTCVELVYTFASGPSARIQIFVDEAAVIDENADMTTGATYNELGVGIVRADHGGFHVFVDDVVLAPQRIHCN